MAGVIAGGRRLLLLTGARAQAEDWLAGCLPAVVGGRPDEVLWIAQSAPAPWACTAATRVTQRLGSEAGLLVFNAYDGLHPDALAAAAGTLRGGGDAILVLPAWGDWATFADPDKQRFAAWPHVIDDMPGNFLVRLQRVLDGADGVVHINPGYDDTPLPRMAPPRAPKFLLNTEQQQAIAAIERVARGHARRPLVLTADRGRGKSTALGVAAARLLQDGLGRISVIAPHSAAVATLWQHAATTAGLECTAQGVLAIGNGELRLHLPGDWEDAGVAESGLVIVDEAAAMPLSVLERLLASANRLVFASTVHGYEGSGRGFELRFRAALARAMPQSRALRLDRPVRWPADDPLERLLNRALLMDAALPEVADHLPAGRITPVDIGGCDAAALVADESLLREVVGLLVNAHYQTRPSDLRQLLDNPDLQLWLARADGRVIGVLVTLREGGFDAATAARIMAGERRPRGHLLPQSLAVHAGFDACLQQHVLRVQRIAVHPARRRRGVARDLMAAAAAWAQGNAIDLLGCAYGVEVGLLAFWQRQDFVPVRLGARVDPASTAHALFMLRGLSSAGRDVTCMAGQAFRADLPWQLGAGLAALDSRIAVLLLRGRDCDDLPITALQQRELVRIRNGARQPATAEALLWRASVHLAARNAPSAAVAPLCAWFVQRQPQGAVCKRFGFAGRKALQRHLQDQVARLCDSG